MTVYLSKSMVESIGNYFGGKGRYVLILILLVIFSLGPIMNSWPLLTGDRAGSFEPVSPDPGVREAYSLMDDDIKFSDNIIYLPHESSLKGPRPKISDGSYYAKYIKNKLYSDNSFNLTLYAEKANIRYLVIDKNSLSSQKTSEEYGNLTDAVDSSKFEKVFEESNISLYEYSESYNEVETYENLSVSGEGLNNISRKNPTLYRSQIPQIYQSDITPKISSVDDSPTIYSFNLASKVEVHKPEDLWSKGLVNDPPLARVTDEIRDNWQFTSGNQILFAKSSEGLKYELGEDDEKATLLRNYKFWDVPNINSSNYNISIEESKGRLQLSTNKVKNETSWSNANLETVNVDNRNAVLVETRMAYENVVTSHIAISGYNSHTGEWSQLNQVPSGMSGTSDFVTHRKVIELGENITKIRPNIKAGWTDDGKRAVTTVDEIKVYGLGAYRTDVARDFSFDIPDGNYSAHVRSFYSNEGGLFRIDLEGNKFRIDTKDSGNKFKWNNIGNIQIDDSSLDVFVSNIEGMNAIDNIKLIRCANECKSKLDTYSSFNLSESNVISSNVREDSLEVKVNSEGTYLLTVGKEYDPNWVAEVSGEIHKPVPINGVKTGFLIDEEGQHTVKIYNKKKALFEKGWTVSILTLLFILSWLFWDWRRRREDEWALRIEKKYLEKREELLDRGKEKLSYVENKV